MQKEIRWLLKEKYPSASLRASNRKPPAQFKKDIERLKAGEPVDYVIGFTEFLGCKIDLSKKPLIPRSETEYWVEKAIREIKNGRPFGAAQGKILHILDIFAGSGCIGIAILKNIKNAKVHFAEKDKKALEQIKINCKINKIKSDRYKIIQSDVFKGLNPSSSRFFRAKYDFVFANPPYIPDYRKNPSDPEGAPLRAILRNRIQKSVLKYEPKKAIFGGKDGLFYIKKFLKDAPSFVKTSEGRGKIYMEFDCVQKIEIEKLLKNFGYKNCEFHKDQYDRWRWVGVRC